MTDHFSGAHLQEAAQERSSDTKEATLIQGLAKLRRDTDRGDIRDFKHLELSRA
jgi:hypothetical protein